MSLAALRIRDLVRHHNASQTGSTAMHGWARFVRESDALNLAHELESRVWSVMVYQRNEVICVDWTNERSANGHMTPMRSEYHG